MSASCLHTTADVQIANCQIVFLLMMSSQTKARALGSDSCRLRVEPSMLWFSVCLAHLQSFHPPCCSELWQRLPQCPLIVSYTVCHDEKMLWRLYQRRFLNCMCHFGQRGKKWFLKKFFWDLAQSNQSINQFPPQKVVTHLSRCEIVALFARGFDWKASTPPPPPPLSVPPDWRKCFMTLYQTAPTGSIQSVCLINNQSDYN